MDEEASRAQPEVEDSKSDPDAEPAPKGRGPRLTRRRLVGMMAGGMVVGGLYRAAIVDRPVSPASQKLSREARQLIDDCWQGLDPAKVIDIHVHIMGLDESGTGCFVHEDATSLLSPVRWVKTRFYKGAAGIHDEARADALYVERLLDLCTNQKPRGRFVILAFDKHYDEAGKVLLERTEFYTPNDYVAGLVRKHPDMFLFGASVHPYRDDALEALRRVKDQGAVLIKWLPNSMGIDPASERCDAFYALAKELRLPIITHGGEEQAVHIEEAQELGNPLRLRRALDAGVKVVVAHCASLGTNRDLDAAPGPDGELPRVSSYELFRRLALDPKYAGKVFGGVSAMTQFNRCGDPLRETIATSELAGALVNGSDYPLPAVDPLIQLRQLEGLGYITPDERPLLSQIFDYNPLTFDFVLKRCLKVKRDGVTHRLPATAFETAHLLG